MASSDEDSSQRRERRKHRSRDKHRKRHADRSSEKRREKGEDKRRKLGEKEDGARTPRKESSRRSVDSTRSRDRERRRSRESRRHRRHRSRSREGRSRTRESPVEKSTVVVKTAPPLPVLDEEARLALEKQRKQEEQEKLDAEMERRRERVRKWQEKRRQDIEKSEKEMEARERAIANKKKWSLEDDEDDEDMAQEEEPPAENPVTQDEDIEMEDAEGDPLEAFMAAEVLPKMEADVKQALFLEEKEEQNAIKDGTIEDARSVHLPDTKADKKKEIDPYASDASDMWNIEEEDDEEDDEEWFKRLQAGRLSKGDRLAPVDHSTINYAPFTKTLYREVREISKMTDEEVKAYRKEIDSIKVRGKEIPKPIKTWSQSGLSERLIEVMRKAGFEKPLPIQAQALSVIMSGRDCIGIAKTGSGKTLAFVLPMLRHIKAQRALESGDGPIGLIMAPTRELVQQIGKEVKRFAKFLDLVCVCVYGGSGVANQINELKRGCEIVVCTPGRMIDLLVTSNGKITNLRRVTFLVLDEADRMFDMGFEPQISRIVSNIRPDRQTVMFSATFPRQVEVLARKLLQEPIEILVGGRSVVNADITQFIEIRSADDRFLRTLEILGQWNDKGKVGHSKDPLDRSRVLIFVNSQDSCDALFRDLLRHGYPCLSLHGGKEQNDRESTISDFKGNVCNLLVATSVAARGLDVRDLVLVLNYEVPDHHEDYVHRVGRTGRAGNKGTAITFIASDEEKYAPDLVKALKESKAPIPQVHPFGQENADLQNLADQFTQKKSKGLALAHGSGYGGSGFKFDEHEEDERKALRKAQQKEFRMEDDSDSDDEAALAARNILSLGSNATANGSVDIRSLPQVQAAHQLAAKMAAQAANSGLDQLQGFMPPGPSALPGILVKHDTSGGENPILAAAKAAAGQIAAKAGMGGAAPAPTPSPFAGGTVVPLGERRFEAELEINDFPQHARWKITHRDTLTAVNELTGAAVTTRGLYQKPGTPLSFGERKLYLLIEGFTESSVRKAKSELKKILAETTEKVMRRDAPTTGKYSVV